MHDFDDIAAQIVARAREEQSSVISIFGPTGSGKTDIAVRVAAQCGSVVVNTDPAQCYRGFPILTNQPDPQHDAIAGHEMIGIWDLATYATVASFAEHAHRVIDAARDTSGTAVLCGGSGMYMLAALTELDMGQHHSDHDGAGMRAHLEEEFDRVGADAFHAQLAELDPSAASMIHPNDRKRAIRAMDVARTGGSIASGSIWDAPQRHATTLVGLQIERSVVHARINARTQHMFDAGVLDEVAGIVGPGADRVDQLSVTARKIHGLSDCIGILRDELTLAQGMEQMATRTRQYAKRQDTWARRWPGLQSIMIAPST